ncbi:MAG: LPS-assembly protein LptD [Deltaproteobacteria bacterium]|nr:LPS-assembly protein LptD [Deltaproteobacteria bacterium]MBW2360300.1 LPS-assembly protein LptD [Deltaproteobacteria bacterium]
MEYESRRKLYVARADADGRVVLRQKERTLSASWVAYSRITRRGVASGDVVISDGRDELHAAFVEFDIDTLEGVMFDAEMAAESTPMELRGAEIAKTGEHTYTFRQGRFTACRCPDPEATEPWQLAAERADLEIDGYGTARNTTVEVLGVPVLWLPWMVYPLRTERQSGLLFPEFAYSARSGTEIGLPIFWAVGDPVNVTLTPRWLSDRGAKGDIEVEYVLGEASDGSFSGAGLYDEDVSSNSLKTPFDKGRWATWGEHDVFLPAGARFKADYAFASDNAYPNDFDELSRARHDRFLTAQAFVTAQTGQAGVAGGTLGAEYRDDLQNPDDTDRDRFVLQRLPTAQVQTLPAQLPFARWLVPALDVRYAWFQQRDRPDSYYDTDPALLVTSNGRFLDTGIDGLPTTVSGGAKVEQGEDGTGAGLDPNEDNFLLHGGTEGDGIFQEGELIADEGHRVVFMPRIGAPLRIADSVELYPEVGWHETFYQSRAQGSERRGILTGRVEASMRLRGEIAGALHLLEPKLGWALVDAPSQRGDPLFVPGTAVPQTRLRDLQLDSVTRDWADRIDDYHAVTLGLGNRFYRRGGGEGAELLADFVVQARYDIENSRFGSLFLDGRAYPFDKVWTRFGLGLDTDAGQLEEALFEIGWSDRRGDGLRFGYRYLREVPAVFEAFPDANRRFKKFDGTTDEINQLDARLRIQLSRGWAIGYRFAYSIERALMLGSRGYVEYLSRCDCWGLAVELTGIRSRGIGINIRYYLQGLGDDPRSLRDADTARRTSLDAFGGV